MAKKAKNDAKKDLATDALARAVASAIDRVCIKYHDLSERDWCEVVSSVLSAEVFGVNMRLEDLDEVD